MCVCVWGGGAQRILLAPYFRPSFIIHGCLNTNRAKLAWTLPKYAMHQHRELSSMLKQKMDYDSQIFYFRLKEYLKFSLDVVIHSMNAYVI